MRAVANSKRGVFDRTTRLMHWLTAGLVLSVFILAFSIDLATSRAAHTVFLQLHRSVGLTGAAGGSQVATDTRGDRSRQDIELPRPDLSWP